MTYDGKGLNPIFYSEISSSFLLYDIFDKRKAVAAAFIKENYNLEADNLQVEREESYQEKGSIDLFIAFDVNDRRCALPIEVKVHDYKSVRAGQISDYYDAVLNEQKYDEIYFVYLTLFNEETKFGNSKRPRSLDEADWGTEKIGERFRHLTWMKVHKFLENHLDKLSKEQRMMVGLHRSWIVEKEKTDLAKYAFVTGTRSLQDYLGDVSKALALLEPLGDEKKEKGVLKLSIDLKKRDNTERNAVLEAIQLLANSERVKQKRKSQTAEHTMQAAAKFLTKMVVNHDWEFVRFYTKLFKFADETVFLELFGKGRGTSIFSIRLHVIDTREFSLCTLKKNKIIEFKLLR